MKHKIVFLADYFSDEIIGGAELTTDAIIEAIDSSQFEVIKLNRNSINQQKIKEYSSALWIICNTAMIQPSLLHEIIQTVRYMTVDYDYRYCKYRSPDLHEISERRECNCNLYLTESLYQRSQHSFWMSQAQRDLYAQHTSVVARKIRENKTSILSSVFSSNNLSSISDLRRTMYKRSDQWIVLASRSWVKGQKESEEYCRQNNLNYKLVGGISYPEFLMQLRQSKGIVYMPPGKDTCPRMIIEAKLLGCDIITNDNVQHANEAWFQNADTIASYLMGNVDIFIKQIEKFFNPKISGYVTTYNCVDQEYPFEACIESLLGFCEEVCVVDAGSTDATLYRLWNLQRRYLTDGSYAFVMQDNYGSVPNSKTRVKLQEVKIDWSDERSAVNDGFLKAQARKMCTGEYCWQSDVDEIVHEDDYFKIKTLAVSRIMEAMNSKIISLPVIEYWGGPEKVRVDVQPWKWRLSLNDPTITHGIPKQLRRYDDQGRLYAAPGTDGCDMIDANTFEVLPHSNFHTQETENLRQAVLSGKAPVELYENWFNTVIKSLPGVHHYSWYNLERKIRTYKHFWSRFWNSLYCGDTRDTAENNVMFDVPWSEVTDDMITSLANKLKTSTGGWIWHSKWNGQNTPSMKIERSEPAIMRKK